MLDYLVAKLPLLGQQKFRSIFRGTFIPKNGDIFVGLVEATWRLNSLTITKYTSHKFTSGLMAEIPPRLNGSQPAP